jgi:hypothetical protein
VPISTSWPCFTNPPANVWPTTPEPMIPTFMTVPPYLGLRALSTAGSYEIRLIDYPKPHDRELAHRHFRVRFERFQWLAAPFPSLPDLVEAPSFGLPEELRACLSLHSEKQ